MMISLEINGLDEARAFMERTGRSLRPAVTDGLRSMVAAGAQHIGQNLLTNQALAVRTGNLRDAVQGWLESDLVGVIGVVDNSAVEKYKWLLGDNPENQPKTIRPKNAKYLAIPLKEALTGSGVVKGEFDRPLKQIGGQYDTAIYPSKSGQLIFWYRRGKTDRSKMRPLFVLKRSVEVYDTGAIADGVAEKLDDMTRILNDKLKEAQR
jgi:hypothetical protein